MFGPQDEKKGETVSGLRDYTVSDEAHQQTREYLEAFGLGAI